MESPSSSLCNLEYEVTSSSFSDLIDCPVLGYSLWDRHLFMPIVVSSDDTSVESSEVGEVTIVEDNSSKKEGRGRRPVPSTLSREVIFSYFHMPVCQAAEELGIGETTLKERCRKVGIPRWPHRKLKSLEALMKNVQQTRFFNTMSRTHALVAGSTRSGTTSATRFYPNASSKRPTASATVTVIRGLSFSCVNGCPTGNASCDASCVMALGSARCWDGCIDSPEGACVLPLLSVLRKSSFGRLPALRVTTMVLDNSNQEPKTKAKAFRFDPHRRRQCWFYDYGVVSQQANTTVKSTDIVQNI
nr:Protein RKD1 [Ipomoea batatas]